MSIRNFCIIAHIDHGKSTLADRLLEITGTVQKREIVDQTLDSMDLERERGITIKLTPVRMAYKGHELNLIDTPGHVDFQYEVSRSLASVEGAILVVDATQGIEAQTLSNVYLALEHDLAIIPVINKIDLPSADVEKVSTEIISLLGCTRQDIIPVSAKTGQNVDAILDAIVERVPEPKKLTMDSQLVAAGNMSESAANVTKALIFDSHYDSYRGVVVSIKVFSGAIKRGSMLEFLSTGAKISVLDVGHFTPKYASDPFLTDGQIGYLVTGLKSVGEARVGDTLFFGPAEAKHAIWGFKQITPFIYAGVYPVDTDEYPRLKDGLEKLMLNDSSIVTEAEVSPALGHGFRCGFLGLLHLDIVKERLWREHAMDVIMTSPQVTYRVIMIGDKSQEYARLHSEVFTAPDGRVCTAISVSNPEDLPKPGSYVEIQEPIARVEILTPGVSIGAMMALAQDHRGVFKDQRFLDTDRVILTYEIPLSELIGDFYDDLKSVSSGYASLSYEVIRYDADDLVRMDILVAGELVEAFSQIVHSSRGRSIGGEICRRLKEEIPKAQFSIAIQASVGGNIIAREDISALRKDVTAKLYGWDVSRKRKLLEKQKEGKKKMKQFGKVSIPSETFVNILKKGE